ERCHGLARCGHSTFLAWHANSRVEATLLPALLRLVDGGWWKSIAQLQGWVHVGVNRKCDSLRVQTNATRDHRQISLPHCVSATDDVTGLRAPLPSPPPLLHYAVFVICFFVDSSDQLLMCWVQLLPRPIHCWFSSRPRSPLPSTLTHSYRIKV
ncbi:Coiled-coil domain containing protein 171, partial [Dissostichus eleginoides]